MLTEGKGSPSLVTLLNKRILEGVFFAVPGITQHEDFTH
jgi:hypothetical protein